MEKQTRGFFFPPLCETRLLFLLVVATASGISYFLWKYPFSLLSVKEEALYGCFALRKIRSSPGTGRAQHFLCSNKSASTYHRVPSSRHEKNKRHWKIVSPRVERFNGFFR
jgi:hypothetical protein